MSRLSEAQTQISVLREALRYYASNAYKGGGRAQQALNTTSAECDYIQTQLDRVLKFLHAYAIGDAKTFVNPRNGHLVTVTDEARALADACLEGPGSLQEHEL